MVLSGVSARQPEYRNRNFNRAVVRQRHLTTRHKQMTNTETIRRFSSFCLAAGMLLVGLLLSCGDDDSVGPGKPAKIIAINGIYYKADSLAEKPLVFAVADKDGHRFPNQMILLSVVDGDGTLSTDTIITDSSSTAGFTYDFTGSLGHAVIRLIAPNIDTIDVYIRRSVIIPGSSGQAQYVLLTDTYAEVRGFNDQPQSIDIDQSNWAVFANYEDSLGLVVLIADVNHNEDADDFEDVRGIAVNTVYNGTTLDSIPIRIGSPFADVRTIYGDPNEIVSGSDTTGPFLRIRYKSLDTEFIGNLDPDTTIIEIDLVEGL
jgi:hypothetical protein